jgi:hypothetical protein
MTDSPGCIVDWLALSIMGPGHVCKLSAGQIASTLRLPAIKGNPAALAPRRHLAAASACEAAPLSGPSKSVWPFYPVHCSDSRRDAEQCMSARTHGANSRTSWHAKRYYRSNCEATFLERSFWVTVDNPKSRALTSVMSEVLLSLAPPFQRPPMRVGAAAFGDRVRAEGKLP